jgi:DNA repair exonuclease SbcCD ATPase subunit
MQVEIEDFKCYKQFNVKINQKGLILIEGASGSGKTTILNAIQFVLYNLNGSRIANKNPKVKLCVDGCEIIRSKHPNRLIVTLNEKKYFDLEAQCWIDQNIKICSVAQNGFDDFLMATSSERRLFLEKLAGFHSEQSILFEEKIFKKNKDLDQQKSVKQGQVELLFKQFQNANKGIE